MTVGKGVGAKPSDVAERLQSVRSTLWSPTNHCVLVSNVRNWTIERHEWSIRHLKSVGRHVLYTPYCWRPVAVTPTEIKSTHGKAGTNMYWGFQYYAIVHQQRIRPTTQIYRTHFHSASNVVHVRLGRPLVAPSSRRLKTPQGLRPRGSSSVLGLALPPPSFLRQFMGPCASPAGGERLGLRWRSRFLQLCAVNGCCGRAHPQRFPERARGLTLARFTSRTYDMQAHSTSEWRELLSIKANPWIRRGGRRGHPAARLRRPSRSHAHPNSGLREKTENRATKEIMVHVLVRRWS